MHNLLLQLRVDGGRKTIGELLREREAAASEIERLTAEINRLRSRSGGERVSAAPPKRSASDEVLIPTALYRMSEVCRLVGLSRSSIYKMVGEGAFPNSVRVSVRSVRWRGADIAAWIATRES